MGAIWRTIRGYILWSYERGSLHYDIMVTLILLFVFVSPHFINFKDKPVERIPHLTGVVVVPGEKGELDLSDPGLGSEYRCGCEMFAGSWSRSSNPSPGRSALPMSKPSKTFLDIRRVIRSGWKKR